MTNTKRLLAMAVAAAVSAPMSVFATNGMNMEGYGPIATAMGGASMAYDNGTAAMMNNPATLGMMDEGNRIDVALGMLGPDISVSMPGMGVSWDSTEDAFYMPAFGWAKKQGKLTYGAGAFAQGGMGTGYEPSSTLPTPGNAAILGGSSAFGGAMSDPSAMGTVMGWKEFSQVGVARILFPVAYNVDSKLTLGGSLDYVRASMDIQMALPGSTMWDMMPTMYNPGATQSAGTMSGSMVDGLMDPAMGISEIYGGYFDFADSNDYTGQASGDGFAAKLGVTYKVNNELTIGGSYHSETSLGDLTGGASMALVAQVGGTTDTVMNMAGDITIKDFQWPATLGVGLSYTPNDKLMVAADLKQIKWADVMKDFKLSFNGGSAGVLDAVLLQNWDDQTVLQLGVAYKVTDAFTVRGGLNTSKNPVPDSTLHYLFPAIIEDHYTAGVGYVIDDSSDVNFSLTIAPEVTQTNPMTPAAVDDMEVSHSQMSWQVMYSKRF